MDLLHGYDCTRPAPDLWPGRFGETKATCPECGRWAWLPNDQTDQAQPDPEPPPPLSRLVCRDHHNRAVDRKGRGCPECMRERNHR